VIGRSLAVIVLLAGGVTAEPSRRPAPDQLSKAAGAEFANAVAAENRGASADAIEHYKRSLELVMHPNTAFNKAEVEARFGYVQHAIASYAMYLSLAPNAKDRLAVEATMKKLATKPDTLVIRTSSKCPSIDTAYVLVDGVLVHKPGGKGGPITAKVKNGEHWVDAVTSVSFTSDNPTTLGGSRRDVSLCPPNRLDGNVVVQYALGLAASLDAVPFQYRGERRVVPPGTHRLTVADRNFECPPVTIKVPKDDSVLYVYVGIAELPSKSLLRTSDAPFRCRKLTTAIHTLTF